MGNIYSVQNIAAYFIYESNEQNIFINKRSLQSLLGDLETVWKQTFGHGVMQEKIVTYSQGYIVHEIEEAYEEYGDHHIDMPAKEWHLPYGQFQLVSRTYGIPQFTAIEEQIVKSVLETYQSNRIRKVS